MSAWSIVGVYVCYESPTCVFQYIFIQYFSMEIIGQKRSNQTAKKSFTSRWSGNKQTEPLTTHNLKLLRINLTIKPTLKWEFKWWYTLESWKSWKRSLVGEGALWNHSYKSENENSKCGRSNLCTTSLNSAWDQQVKATLTAGSMTSMYEIKMDFNSTFKPSQCYPV